jgi:hypothetical protein
LVQSRRDQRGPSPTAAGTSTLFAIVMLLLPTACGDDDAPNGAERDVELDPATATLVYRFNDSSVPPEYHRSYTLTADASSANLVVDSYGDVLHDVTEPNVVDVWQRTIDASQDLADLADVTDDGCTGGTSEELRVLDEADHAVVDARVDHCGSSSDRQLAPAIADLLALFDVDELLQTG